MQITAAVVQAMIDEDSTLWTLKRIELTEVLAVLKEHHPVIKDEDELFEALLDVMYKTRPTGPI